jgi:2-polyprenyl-6-methoxyphenol hydroxylase-like FAD-dependent oxidoreductase
MTKDNPIKIIVVGAGIGGIACAVECKKKGFDVSMYDQVKVRPPLPPLTSRTFVDLEILSYCTPFV